MNRALLRGALIVLLGGCAPAVEEVPATPAPEANARAAESALGQGTLRQEQLSVELRAGDVQLRVTPLEEEIIRLAAPDTHSRLRSIAERPRQQSESGAVLLLVSFVSRESGQTFAPEEVTIESAGRAFRPLSIFPLSAGWGEQRLTADRPQSAVYVFDPTVDFGQRIVIRYQGAATSGWASVLPVLQAERARIGTR